MDRDKIIGALLDAYIIRQTTKITNYRKKLEGSFISKLKEEYEIVLGGKPYIPTKKDDKTGSPPEILGESKKQKKRKAPPVLISGEDAAKILLSEIQGGGGND